MKPRTLGTSAGIALVLTVNSIVAQPEQARAANQPTTNEYRVDAGTLARFSPRARADLVAVILQQWKLAEAASIDSADRVHHFVAQIETETGGLRLIAENLNYSAERLLEVFPRRVTPQQAEQLAHKPVLIANHIYNGRLGNRLPNDG
jgi:putative chitinase